MGESSGGSATESRNRGEKGVGRGWKFRFLFFMVFCLCVNLNFDAFRVSYALLYYLQCLPVGPATICDMVVLSELSTYTLNIFERAMVQGRKVAAEGLIIF